jgi:hypothetical protein
MFKQVYKRSVNWKPPCRLTLELARLDAEGDRRDASSLCVGRRLTWLSVECQRCPSCTWAPSGQKAEVSLCPLPTKDVRDALTTSSTSNVSPSSIFNGFPELWLFLTSNVQPDGSKRLPGTISLSLNGSMWQLALTDLTLGLYSALHSTSLDDLVLMIESRMADGTFPWKLSKYPPKKK